MDWKECKADVETWDVSFRWRFSPGNWLTRRLWGMLEFNVDVDWVRLLGKADKKKGKD